MTDMEENNIEEVKTKKSESSFKLFSVLFVLLIALGGYGAAYYYFNQYKQTKIVIDNPEIANQNEVKSITAKLGVIYQLPEDETPTVATVLDKEKLKTQPFFAKAENGDKVIIYSKSQTAILYRVDANKIITVAPVSLQQPEPSTAPKNIEKEKVMVPTAEPSATSPAN